MIKKVFIALWLLAGLFLFLYSFTQVDLSLTFSRASIWQEIQKGFQYIGYFNRPLSTSLYIGILLILFLLYGWTLFLIHKKRIDKKIVRLVILLVSILLLLSYNAFSYDLFNYIFDAKIVTHYNQNPYDHKALDFPGDPMLSFMRWTHRVYPYGPLWLALTVPLSYLGLGYFIVTFYLFKALMVAAFLGSAYLIYKIAEKTKVIEPLFAAAFFAFNPLVLIESLVSAHNDIVMIFFALLSIYFLVQKKNVFSFTSLVVSAAIKFGTAFLAPVEIIYMIFPFLKKKISNELFFLACLLVMGIPVYLASIRTTFQPWYTLYLLMFAPFLAKKYYIIIPAIILSLSSLTQYIPFLYVGNWDPPIPVILDNLSYIGVILSIVGSIAYFIYSFLKKRKR